MVSVNILDQLMGRQREREWKSSSFLRYCEEVFVDKMVENEGENFEMVASWFTFRTGPTQAIAFSPDGQYMASGHTSRNHEVFVHQLVPEACVFNKLVGHPRTPWCLTFDPSCTYILYSGCLGGVVNRWNIKTGTLLGSFSCEVSTPINSIEVLPTSPAHILIAMRHALYLVSGEELQVVWKAESSQGDLRQVKYLAEGNKLLTVIKGWRFPIYHRLQIRGFDFTVPPDLTFDRGAPHCSITSPQCVVMTAKSVIFCDKTGVFLCAHSNTDIVQHKHYFVLIDDFELALKVDGPKITFIDISPCEKYLLVGIKVYHPIPGMCIVIADLEKNELILKEHYPVCFNCAMWMPSSSAYGTGVCIGNYSGNIVICSDNKQLQCRDQFE